MLTKSIHRHLLHFTLVLILFGIGFWYGSDGKAELKGESKANKEEIVKLSALLNYIAKQPKIKVHNNIEDVKVKDGSTLDFTPEIEIEQNNIRDPVSTFEPDKPKATKTQLRILELEYKLNRLVRLNKRKRKQGKLRAEIERLRNPP